MAHYLYIVHYSTSYYEVSHILCPSLNNPVDDLADSFNVAVAISTFSTTSIVVFIEAIAIERETFILEYEMCNLYVTQWAILELIVLVIYNPKMSLTIHLLTHTHTHSCACRNIVNDYM